MKHTTTRSASDYRAQARKALKGRWESVVVPYVLAVFAAAMLTAFLCMILWIITVDEMVMTLGVYIGAVIAFPLIVGFCHICLRVLKSRKRISGDQIMFGYKRCSMPAILAPTIIYLMLFGISVAFGFATGGSEAASKHRTSGPNNMMGGGGAGVTVTPLGFLIVKEGNVRYLGIPEPAHGSFERIIDKAPDLMDQISGLMDKVKEKKAGEAAVAETAE